ncbi:MAG: hypothetical protein GX454_05840 [Brooklawnia sp.]|nr:hypothetical protein [Brooklawnia sp.]
MSPYPRKVKTASGTTAVQIVEKRHGQRRIVEHLGSAHDEAELAALLQAGRDKLHANQPPLDLPVAGGVQAGMAVVEAMRSQLLIDVILVPGNGSGSTGSTMRPSSNWSRPGWSSPPRNMTAFG